MSLSSFNAVLKTLFPDMITKLAHPDNYAAQRGVGYKVEGVVLHGTSGVAVGSVQWFATSLKERALLNHKYALRLWEKSGKKGPMPTLQPAFPSSAHTIFYRTGQMVQTVPFEANAYHVGAMGNARTESAYGWARTGLNLNRVTIGIEHELYTGAATWPEAMVESSVKLVKALGREFGFVPGPKTVLLHRDLAPTACPLGNTPPLSRWYA